MTTLLRGTIFFVSLAMSLTSCTTSNPQSVSNGPELVEHCLDGDHSGAVVAQLILLPNQSVPLRAWVDWGINNTQGQQNLGITESLDDFSHTLTAISAETQEEVNVSLGFQHPSLMRLRWASTDLAANQVLNFQLRVEYSSPDSGNQIYFSDKYSILVSSFCGSGQPPEVIVYCVTPNPVTGVCP